MNVLKIAYQKECYFVVAVGRRSPVELSFVDVNAANKINSPTNLVNGDH